jgi:hypothetical protein
VTWYVLWLGWMPPVVRYFRFHADSWQMDPAYFIPKARRKYFASTEWWR